MPKSRTGWGLLIGTAFLAVLVVIGIVPRLRQNAELVAASTAPDAGLVQVSVIAPKRADGPIHLVLPSNIQAIEEAAIYARTSGYVRERDHGRVPGQRRGDAGQSRRARGERRRRARERGGERGQRAAADGAPVLPEG